MQRLIIQGGNRIGGEVTVPGAKNSVLPLLAGCVLTSDTVELENCPGLSDVFAALRILTGLGCKCKYENNHVTVNSVDAENSYIPDDLMREMRSSIVFLGAILGRSGSCRLSFPGGCELGPRPIDMHLSALKRMGVKISETYGVLECTCPLGLNGADISLSFPSVGATENIMLAAVLANGETIIRNAAREPEIADLGNFLNACGGKIIGQGTDMIVINGVEKLHGCEYSVMPDRIAAATFMAAAAATGGELWLNNAGTKNLAAVIPIFEQMGCRVYSDEKRMYINCPQRLRAVETIRTMPYPGFPTDAQAIVMAVLAKADGTSVMVENIFENRYRHVDEMVRMGADIKAEGKVAVIDGVKKLYGANVRATDLRGGAALVIAALSAEGNSVLTNVRLIDRGYENIENMLTQVGANVRRVNN